MAEATQTLTYARASELRADGLDLASAGGTPGVYVDGFLEQPRQAATGLLLCATIARSRFHDPTAARDRDPVLTAHDDRLRIESFSSCCSVYGRYDVLPDGLDRPPVSRGTTNVDVNDAMRDALVQVADGDPLHLRIGAEGLTATTMGAQVLERKVTLPRRWLKGFGEVQVASAGLVPIAELTGAVARRALASLSAPAGRISFLAPLGTAGRSSGLRPTARSAPGTVSLDGTARVRLLRSLAPFATGLRILAPDAGPGGHGGPSAWLLDLPGGRFTLVLSPQSSRGFSGEGGLLDALADPVAVEDADLVGLALGWQAVLRPAATGLSDRRATQALTVLGATGRVGHDAGERAWFHRELPYDLAAVRSLHPRLARAADLADRVVPAIGGAVHVPSSSGGQHRVTLDPDSCTCTWWAQHPGTRGPCAHVLAATLAAGSAGPAPS